MTTLSYTVSALLAVTLSALLVLILREAWATHLRCLDRVRGRR